MGTSRSCDGRSEPERVARTRGSGSGGVFAPRAEGAKLMLRRCHHHHHLAAFLGGAEFEADFIGQCFADFLQ